VEIISNGPVIVRPFGPVWIVFGGCGNGPKHITTIDNSL
jgi:hypothetical protein